MTDWIKSFTLIIVCLLMAGQSSGQTAFNDRGSFYNPLLFIEATSPVKDIVTLRFANNEEYFLPSDNFAPPEQNCPRHLKAGVTV